MSLFQVNPFALTPSRGVDLFDDFDRQFNSYFNSFPSLVQAQQAIQSSVPPLDLSEHDNGYELKLSVPGVAPSDLTVDFDTEKNTLFVKGETSSIKKDEKKDETSGNVSQKISERYSGTFERTIQFPSKVKINDDDISASLVHGVLTLKIPKVKAEETKLAPKRITVEGEPKSETK